MKSQKISETQWRITAPNGSFANLNKCFDGWEVSCWMAGGQRLICHGGIHEKRFDAKVEAEQLLAK